MADLATLAQVKAYLGLATSLTTDDVLLAQIISAESAMLTKWMSREFGVVSHTDVFSGNGKSQRMLVNSPAVSVTAVEVDGMTLGSSLFLLNGNILTLLLGRTFAKGMMNCSITYTAGYATVPNDVAQACVELVAKRYKDRDRVGLVSKGLAGETTMYETKALPDHVKLILQQYKKVVPV